MVKKFNLEKLVRSNVLKLVPYSSARDEYTATQEAMIFLDANENPNESGLNRYPDPQQRALKTKLGQLRGVDPTEVLIGNGSDEVLDLLFRTFCEPGRDEVLIMPPTYGMYKVLANVNDISCTEVPLTTSFEIDLSNVRAALTPKTKLIFICSPNNPTGNVLATAAIESLLSEYQGILVVDEAYVDFHDGERWVKRLKEFPNLVVTQTLSKAYGLAGIRLGIAYASPAIIKVLNKIKPPYNVNSLSQEQALKALGNQAQVSLEIEELKIQRERLQEALKQVPFVKRIHPSSANFILVEVDDANHRYKALIEAGIVVRNRTTQLHCKNHLRFSVGTPQEMDRLLHVLQTLT